MPSEKTPSKELINEAVFRKMAEEMVVKQGDYIFKQGQEDPHFYIIAEGEIAISIRDQGGQEKDIAFVHPGELLGEGVLSGKTLKPASARALTDVRCLRLSYDHFKALTESEPDTAIHFLLEVLNLVNRRLNRTNIRLMALAEISQTIQRHRDDLHGMAKSLLRQLLHLLEADDAILVLKNPFTDDYRTIASTRDDLTEKTLKDFGLLAPGYMTDSRGHWLILNLKGFGAIALVRAAEKTPFEQDHMRLGQLVAEQAAGAIDEASRRAAEKAKTILHQKRYVL